MIIWRDFNSSNDKEIIIIVMLMIRMLQGTIMSGDKENGDGDGNGRYT